MIKKFFFRKKKGFTLIELLIVVAIIGIIAGIAIPRFLGARTKAKVTKAFADMANIATALEMYYVDYDRYPEASGTAIDTSTGELTSDYISSIPDDPFGTTDVSNYRYYTNKGTGDPALTSATAWLLVSNGPDGAANTTDPSLTGTLVAGQLGGPDGIMTGYGYTADGGAETGWSVAKSKRDLGDIGRGGP